MRELDRAGMVGNFPGVTVQAGFLPSSEVDFTSSAGYRIDRGGQMRVGAMVLPGPLQHQRSKGHAQSRDAA